MFLYDCDQLISLILPVPSTGFLKKQILDGIVRKVTTKFRYRYFPDRIYGAGIFAGATEQEFLPELGHFDWSLSRFGSFQLDPINMLTGSASLILTKFRKIYPVLVLI